MGKPIIVDVPLAAFAPLAPKGTDGGSLQPQVRYCEEERPSGRRCPWPALEGKTRCERHEVWHRDVTQWTGMRYPDGPLGVQEALGSALARMLSEGMSPQRGRVIADLCRLMVSNLRHCERAMAEAERNHANW